VFHDFSCSIARGQWLWLFGPSGCGKTSLALVIAGLIEADAGAVRLGAERLSPALTDRTPRQRRAIQYLYQHGSDALNPARSVDRQLRHAWRHAPHLLAEGIAALELAETDLRRRPGSYSLGEIQRFNLLRALAQSPLLLLCDEILAPLNLVLKQRVMNYLAGWQERTGAAVLMITHDPALANLRPFRSMYLRLPAA